MTICVTNCLHWIGFHIVNRLIENDYKVDGIADISSKREEELSLMLGRNSSFSLYKQNEIKDKQYSEAVLFNVSKTRSVQALKTYNFGKDIDEPNFINIELPLLFGEWMPMDEKGVYVNDQYIQFYSNRFQEEAIYINDFVDCFMQWLKVADLPNNISLTRNKNLQVKEDTLEKQLYIRENRPIDDQISNLIKHYEKVKKYKM